MPKQRHKKLPRDFGIAQRLRLSREAAGLSQAALADAVNCSVTTIHFVETSFVKDPHASLIFDCARTLRVRADFLLGLTGDSEPYAES